MAFRIKDLMINLAPSRGLGGLCAEDRSCGGARTDQAPCPEDRSCGGQHTDVPPCEDARSCGGRHTDVERCPEDRSCGGQHTDVAPCEDARSCGGRHTDEPDCGEQKTFPVCVSFRSCAGRRTNAVEGGDSGETLDDLKLIKAELLAELGKIDCEIQTLEEGRAPETVEEVEKLESGLKEALEELGRIKADLGKK